MRFRILLVKNVAAAEGNRLASHPASPDDLAPVRFGLRAADDPRISETGKVIDLMLSDRSKLLRLTLRVP